MAQTQQTLQARSLPRLATATAPVSQVDEYPMAPAQEEHKKKMTLGMKLLLWFVIVFIVVWFVLYMAHPTWVQNVVNGAPDGTINNFKCVLYSLIVAIIVTLIVWFVCRK